MLAGREMFRDFLLAAAEAEELEAAGELQRGACPLTPTAGRPTATVLSTDSSNNDDDATRNTVAQSDVVSESNSVFDHEQSAATN